MKRQAEGQLTKDNEDGNSGDEEMGERGMKKASDAELGRRTIRPLPTRGKQPVQPAFTVPSTTTTGANIFATTNPFGLKSDAASGGAPPTPSFFGGFGAKSTALEFPSSNSPTTSSLFGGFGPKSTAPEFAGGNTTSNAFTPSTTSPFPSTYNSKPPAPPSSTSTSFAALLRNTTPSITNSYPPPTQAPQVPQPISAPGKPADESNTVKYLKNLRGLNTSLLSSLTKFVQDDPYVDLTEALEKYRSFRTKIQAEFDESPAAGKPTAATPAASPSTNEKPAAAMPAPPPTFSGFGGFKLPPASPSTPTATSSNGPGSGGFKPSPSVFSSTTPGPFSLPTESKSSGFTFGGSTSSSTAPSPAAASPFFGFGTSSNSSTAPSSTFGSFGSSASKPSEPSAAPSNPFGISSTNTTGLTFGKPAEKSENSSSNPFSVPEKSSPTPNFFSIPATSKSAPSIFGSGSIPSTNPFGKPETKASADDNTMEGEGSERGTPAAEGDATTSNLITVNPLDEEGAGEENEETVHAIKAKAFKLSKDAEGAAKWLQLGTGILRLKKDKETDGRRVLLRNSTNGKVIVNFKIYSGLKPTQNKSALSFVGHEDGAPVTFSIRVANEGDAKNLKEALDREIAEVKAK